MPATLTIVFFIYAVVLGLFGAPLWAVAVVGGLACLWQVVATLARGFVPPPAPEPDVLLDEDERALLDLDDPADGLPLERSG